jgi:hypothetical protein
MIRVGGQPREMRCAASMWVARPAQAVTAGLRPFSRPRPCFTPARAQRMRQFQGTTATHISRTRIQLVSDTKRSRSDLFRDGWHEIEHCARGVGFRGWRVWPDVHTPEERNVHREPLELLHKPERVEHYPRSIEQNHARSGRRTRKETGQRDDSQLLPMPHQRSGDLRSPQLGQSDSRGDV